MTFDQIVRRFKLIVIFLQKSKSNVPACEVMTSAAVCLLLFTVVSSNTELLINKTIYLGYGLFGFLKKIIGRLNVKKPKYCQFVCFSYLV